MLQFVILYIVFCICILHVVCWTVHVGGGLWGCGWEVACEVGCCRWLDARRVDGTLRGEGGCRAWRGEGSV